MQKRLRTIDSAPRLLAALLLASLPLFGACDAEPLALGGDLGPGPDFSVDSAGSDATLADTAPDLPLTDSAPSCTPQPFVPPGTPAGFEHSTTRLLVVTQGPANHRGQDVVAVEGAPQVLIGKFAYGPLDKDLVDEQVAIFVQEAPPCGPWTSLAVERTSDDGDNGATFGIEDDGGRVFFEIPAAERLPMGRYPIRMLVRGDFSVAAFSLFVVRPQTSTVIFDIDGTLTTDDFQLVSQLLGDLRGGSYVPAAHPGGKEVVASWVSKGYLPVYLTARPGMLSAISKSWLVDGQFPPGVLHLTDSNAQALPVNTANYKTDFLKRLIADAKLDLLAAYGNAETDIEAYERAPIAKERTFIIGPNAGKQGTVALTSYTAHLPTAQAMPQASVAAPADTFGW